MLVLAGANAVSVVLFGTVFLLAGAGVLGQAGFVVCLATMFALATVVWVRTEARHRALDPLRRFGRVMIGLVVIVLATPVVVLMPIFWLESHLPPDADFRRYVAGMMAVVLMSLALTLAVNVVGGLAIGVRALAGARGRIARRGPGID